MLDLPRDSAPIIAAAEKRFRLGVAKRGLTRPLVSPRKGTG